MEIAECNLWNLLDKVTVFFYSLLEVNRRSISVKEFKRFVFIINSLSGNNSYYIVSSPKRRVIVIMRCGWVVFAYTALRDSQHKVLRASYTVLM